MSGDVQPRKRKDNKIKRKKDSIDLATAELIARKLSLKDDDDTKHAGVHAAKMGPDDLLMHLQKDESTGGHWCAKIVFFSLMAILFGLVGLIILENRGINDLDTPLSESRFSEYFEGWVDEHRDGDHDEHDVLNSLDELDEHTHDNEPFAEEDDNSEANDDDDDENDDDDDDDVHDHDDNHVDEGDEDHDDENHSDEDKVDDSADILEQESNEDVDDESVEEQVEKQIPSENIEDGEEEEPVAEENTDDFDVSSEDEIKNDSFDNDDSPFEEHVHTNILITGDKLEKQVDELLESFNKLADSLNHSNQIEAPKRNLKWKDMDDDGSFEEVYENDDGEDLYLQKIAKNKQKQVPDEEPKEPEPHESSPDDKNTEQRPISLNSEHVDPDLLLKRRLTIIAHEDAQIYSKNYDEIEDLDKYSDQEEYSDEDDISEEELEEPIQIDEQTLVGEKIASQTYEQLKAMYKAQVPENETPEPTEETIQSDDEINVEVNYNEEVDYDDDEEEDEEEDNDEELEDEEEISDVDDNELMKRLEDRYGRLPQPESDVEPEEEETWTKLSSRGPQEFDEENIEEELSRANTLLEDDPTSSLKILNSLVQLYPNWPEALYGKAKALDRLSEIKQSNLLLSEAIENYLKVLTLGKSLNNTFIKIVGERCIFRMRFKGLNEKAVTVHKMLINRFKDNPHYRNQLAITYLLNNDYAKAKFVLHETLLTWRYDGVALVHYGFVLKNLDNNLQEAVTFLQEGIDSDADGTQDGRFYLALGDSLMRLGRNKEAIAIYKKGAKKHVFLSENQRSLYNVDRLKSHPFWSKKETTQEQYFKILEENWEKIRGEGLSVLNEKGFFENETESLRDYGDWKQFELFSRGKKNIINCAKTPFTCKLIETFPAARFCTRGQIKFSVLHPGTHIWPHTGPTNCRIRAHLGLVVPTGTSLRVVNEKRTWGEGKTLCFDDSFEHEVWHNGTTTRLVLIVDIWHPDLTKAEWKSLSPI